VFAIKSYGLDLLLYLFNHLVAHIPSHTVRRFFLLNVMRLELGEGSSVHMGLRLYTRGQISLGKHTVIDRDCVLDGRGYLTIGNNVNLAPEVMILTAYHDPDDGEHFSGMHKPVVIEDYAWIATRALILPGVTVGRGAIVAAGAVVTKDVPSQTIVGGNPARFIRDRKGTQQYQLNYERLFH
jgi:acetyltransferase-like isoleucine patch superfamily enzyme